MTKDLIIVLCLSTTKQLLESKIKNTFHETPVNNTGVTLQFFLMSRNAKNNFLVNQINLLPLILNVPHK